MKRPAAILFDCDGVIVDSEGPTIALFLDEFALHGLQMSKASFEAEFVGSTVETVAVRARAAGAVLPDGWVSAFYRRMYAMLEAGVPLVAGVAALLDRLDRAGIPYAMASNGSHEKMQITLGQHGLEGRFKAVLSGQSIGRPKPAPDIYLRAAKACAARPEECLVIEDSVVGARAAIVAGIPCLGFAPHGPDALIARKLTGLGVPLFDRMDSLPKLIGLD